MTILNNILRFLAALAIGELIALVVFYYIRKKFESGNKKTSLSIIKGVLERFIILLGLASSLPTILIFFSAVKLGTRLKDQQESKVSNDYFLIGNICSVTIAIIEHLFYLEFI